MDKFSSLLQNVNLGESSTGLTEFYTFDIEKTDVRDLFPAYRRINWVWWRKLWEMA